MTNARAGGLSARTRACRPTRHAHAVLQAARAPGPGGDPGMTGARGQAQVAGQPRTVCERVIRQTARNAASADTGAKLGCLPG
jgi:hypothetical protein